MYFFVIILLAILLPIAEGFLLAYWVKLNEAFLFSPGAVVGEDIPTSIAETNAVEIDSDQATEFVADLLDGQTDENETTTENEAEAFSEPADPDAMEPAAIEPERSDAGQSKEKESNKSQPKKSVAPAESFDPSRESVDDSGQLLQSFFEGGIQVDEAFQEMLADETPEISPDLEQRIEEDASSSQRLDDFRKAEELSAEESGELENPEGKQDVSTDHEALKDVTPDGFSSEEIDFSQEIDEQTQGIAPMAAELFGEDFDFGILADATKNPESPVEQEFVPTATEAEIDTKSASEAKAETEAELEQNIETVGETVDEANLDQVVETVGEMIDGAMAEQNPEQGIGTSAAPDLESMVEWQSEASEFQNDTTAPVKTRDATWGGTQTLVGEPLMMFPASGAQDIRPTFPKELVRDVLIEPDDSETARRNSFIEESRPMFFRQRRKS